MPSITARLRAMRRVEATLRRMTRALDALMHRVYGWRGNPLHQSGALASWLLLILTVTGLYLLLVYRIGAPAESVARLAADPWLGSWVRSLHRYATDAFVLAALLHAVRLVGQAREWGPRTRAWVSGIFLFGVGLLCAWTGFVMAWDTLGLRIAVMGARLVDALPIVSEPVSRLFAGDRPVPGTFFFLNLFIHIALPLAMGTGLWLHISKVARPVLTPPRVIRWTVTLTLLGIAVVLPAPLGPAADLLGLPSETPLALTTTWWLPMAERAPAWAVWMTIGVLGLGALLVPRLARRPRTGSWAQSVVDPQRCTGCDQCTQDCPWEAIRMVERDDDRPTLVARVDPSLCVSCGICAGSCAPMGVGPPGRTGRDQFAVIREGPVSGLPPEPGGRLVVVACAQGAASLRHRLASLGAYIHEVPCVGGLHSSVVELLLRQGAGGVMVTGCPPRDCVGREGPKWLEQRFYHDREAELQARVDRRRVRTVTAAVGLDGDVLAAFETFRREIAALETVEPDDALDLLALCASDREEAPK